MNIYERFDRECRSEHCDDYGSCTGEHTEDRHDEIGFGFCAKMASSDCAICQAYAVIYREIENGEAHERICYECHNVFNLSTGNPYSEVLYAEGVGVYFQCDACFILESHAGGPDED